MQTLKTIWRVENKQGKGPFGYGRPLSYDLNYLRFDCLGLLHVHEHPRFDRQLKSQFEKIKHDISFWKFGFESLDAYERWFPDSGMNKFLMEQGYFLRAFHVDAKQVLSGDHQSMFFADAAQAACCKSDLSVS